jgi:hypothetical protein
MIRKIIPLFIIITFIISSCFNGTNVPSLVKKKFEELYPNNKEVQWVTKDSEKYTATFKQDDKSYIANFSKYGIWLETKSVVAESAIPPISVAYVKQFYPKATIAENYKLKNPDGDFFEIDVKKDTLTFAIIFDKEGKLFSDDNNVLLKNFKKMYTNPADVKWVRAEDGNFDVFFKDNGKACKVSFTIDGTWIETQTIAAETEVPAIAFEYIKRSYRPYELKGIIFEKTSNADLFNIVIINKGKEINLYFDLEGNFIRKEGDIK